VEEVGAAAFRVEGPPSVEAAAAAESRPCRAAGRTSLVLLVRPGSFRGR
jgi:hypothetical protein